jgi:hypothetical protein
VRICVALALLAACGKSDDKPAAAAPPAGSAGAWSCEQLPFAASTPVPEASAAAWLTVDGKQVLVVVGDSGQHGAYGLVDPDSGSTLEQGTLPLGDAGDDLEGLSALGDRLFGLTSAGWLRAWERRGKDFVLVAGPYAIGEGDMICGKNRSNCARDYEGLCLRPSASTGCVGYAASRADGALYCLTAGDAGYRVDRARVIPIARKGVVADCTYCDDCALRVGNNLFGKSQVFRVEGDADPEHAKVVPIAQLGAGFPEVIAVRGELVYRMSDAGGSPSLMAKFRCRAPAR